MNTEEFERLGRYSESNILRGDLQASQRFQNESVIFKELKEKFIKLKSLNNNLTEVDRFIVNSALTDFLTHIKVFTDFSINSTDTPRDVEIKRAKISDDFKKFVIQTSKDITGIIAYCQSPFSYEQESKNTLIKIEALEASSKKTVENVSNVVTQQNNIVAQASETRKKAESLLDEAKKYAGELIAQTYAKMFSDEAKKHRILASVSFGVFVFLLVFASLYLYKFSGKILVLISLLNKTNDGRLAENMLYSIGFEFILRMSFFIIFYLAIREALRNYNFNMNLYVINRHKHNILASFDVIIENSKHSSGIKDEVLREVISAIYNPISTGYGESSKKGLSINEITDLIKTLKPN